MATRKIKEKRTRREFLKTGTLLGTSALLPNLANASDSKPLSPKAGSPPSVKLNNGVHIPMVGFGTFPFRGQQCTERMIEAVESGYRLFDTAKIYANEDAVGVAIKQCGVARDELFITTKIWHNDFTYEGAKTAFNIAMDKLGLEYLDLYLIHRPRPGLLNAWRAMEELYEEGRIRALGVSNIEVNHLDKLLSNVDVKPVLNQIESHSFFHQPELHRLMQKHNIYTQAWSPFAQGRHGLFSNPTLVEIGKQYGKTAAQVNLRWLFQRGIISIPRTSKKAHMDENMAIFDFELSNVDMVAISRMDLGKTAFPEWLDPKAGI